ncbi:MAG: glycosyltransferase [Euryarchaeota archaeon]|jgi:glycosyltransferase involved in cell wall biosynthesis|nr:glycosyltransferase [Euryarchaeota archaeon]MBT4982244.1 glycosyltransferase [Euryarchaeota archaeon]MBT5183871.1 glycosyltransferase [Euryarchaeota archaeon]
MGNEVDRPTFTFFVETQQFMEVRVCAVVPVLNEGKFIKRCIDSLLAQTVPIDILVLDGGSNDGTLDHLSKYGDSIVVIDNPGKRVAQARNLALQHISEDITHCLEIIGHSWIDPDHVEIRIKELLQVEKRIGMKIGAIGCRTKAGDSKGAISQWVEGALSSPIGSGGGQFKPFKGCEKTKVPAFCLHRVEALRDVEGWDERFITSQDSDLSMRMISAGWQLWRSDSSCVYMHKRSTLTSWWKMSHRYGFWRTKVILKHPKRFDIRELLPLIGLVLIFLLETWWWAPAVYGAALLLMGLIYRPKDSGFSAVLGIPLCLIILHTSFTIGLFDGIFRTGRVPSDRP